MSRLPAWSPTACGTAAVLCLAGSSSAFAVDYLSEAQVRQLLFPAAAQWQDERMVLTPEQLQALARAAQLPARSAAWRLTHAFDAQHKYLGTLVLDQVIGKFELISYAVALDSAGNIAGVEILSYRESHGGEIRLPAWRRQFVGKGPAQPLRVGEDIQLISGATLSCSHVTDGVRRIVTLLALLRGEHRLPA